ncbi:hypothetical protein [Psychrobacter sp. WY6]|uniref:hypothetical protein n=1 Tax=Psychrobacter sp. WY6 TaxID=2708350 RepID=UPI002022E8FA|nr:hypothetical protein [Psychrobacter sp. WY6]
MNKTESKQYNESIKPIIYISIRCNNFDCFYFGVANAHNEYAMAAAKQPSVEAYTKAHAAEKVARAEAIAKADVAIAKANAAIAKVESARAAEKAVRAEEKIARAKAYAAWAESNAEAARVKPEKRIERLSTVKHYNLP